MCRFRDLWLYPTDIEVSGIFLGGLTAEIMIHVFAKMLDRVKYNKTFITYDIIAFSLCGVCVCLLIHVFISFYNQFQW